MKSFAYPDGAWFPKSCFDVLCQDHERAWQRLLAASSGTGADAAAFLQAQNEAMLLKFFLEQAFGPVEVVDRTRQLLDRDQGGLAGFRALFMKLATADAYEWLVWGLSFADFRLHLFPVGGSAALMPFCISPVLAACLRADLVKATGLERAAFAAKQFERIDWSVVDARITCLQKPLDLLADYQDCVEEKGCTT